MPSAKKTSARPIRRRDPDRTRGQLLRAAIRLFSAKGYHGVSVDEVVASAKVNKRMVYHYFGGKEELYLAALENVFDRLAKADLGGDSSDARPDDKLRRLLAANFAFLDSNPEFVRLLLWENLDEGRHLAAHPERLSKNPFMERFRVVVEEGIALRIFRKPTNMSHLLINFIGLSFIYYSNRHSLAASLHLSNSEAERKERVQQAIDLVFNGLLPR